MKKRTRMDPHQPPLPLPPPQAPKHTNAEAVTGPVALKTVAFEYWMPAGRPGLTVLDPGLIYPFDWHRSSESPEITKFCSAYLGDLSTFDREKCKALLPEAFAVTYWRHSWEQNLPKRWRPLG
jgi:hypothetical protein